MTVRSRLRFSWLTSSIVLIVGVVAVIGFVFAENSTRQQEQDLLQSNTNQAAAYASQSFVAIDNLLVASGSAVTSTIGDAKKFDGAHPSSTLETSFLAKMSGPSFVVTATTGKQFHVGQVVSGAPLSTINQQAASENRAKKKAQSLGKPWEPSPTAGPVSFYGKQSTARFAIVAPVGLINYVVYEQFTLNPFIKATELTGKAFSQLNATLYGPGAVSMHDLFVSTSSSIHLAGPVAHATTSIASTDFTLVAAARHPFIGGFARYSATLLLVLGLFLAGILGLAIESLHRRRRYAEALVKERTADLERSLCTLEEAQDALVRGERLTAVGEMAMVVGHELRNPLAAVINALYLIRAELREPMSEILLRNLSMAERETNKAATLADDLTAFVRPREMDRVTIAVEGLVEEVLSVSPLPPGVDLVTDVDPFNLMADRGQMAEILTNLVTNAYQAMPEGGTLGIRAKHGTDGVHLVVEDSGSGIDEAVAERVFEPFFTTKYNGTGLGLAIVQRLVVAHGGRIDFENVSSGGVRVTLLIPDQLELVAT